MSRFDEIVKFNERGYETYLKEGLTALHNDLDNYDNPLKMKDILKDYITIDWNKFDPDTFNVYPFADETLNDGEVEDDVKKSFFTRYTVSGKMKGYIEVPNTFDLFLGIRFKGDHPQTVTFTKGYREFNTDPGEEFKKTIYLRSSDDFIISCGDNKHYDVELTFGNFFMSNGTDHENATSELIEEYVKKTYALSS